MAKVSLPAVVLKQSPEMMRWTQRVREALSSLNTEISEFIAGSSGPVTNEIITSKLIVVSTVPTAANSTGTRGMIVSDENYIYVCIATNTWKRSALSSW
jgi:hypothetical protein